MHIFNHLKTYDWSYKTAKENIEDISSRKRSTKERIKDFFEETLVLWLLLGVTVAFGTLWYVFSSIFCGMMFFGLLACIAFMLITSFFAKLSDFFEKKLGETKGLT